MYKIILLFSCFLALKVFPQKLNGSKEYYLSAIGFWNLENLYDTLNDPWKNDDDFTMEGSYKWNGERYWTKIDHLATVISQIATDATADGLAILGVCEVENKSVLADLVQSIHLKKRNYQIIHVDGPDARGVDPALIYNPIYFKVETVKTFAVVLKTDSSHKTRDILMVKGKFGGENLAVFVNHWPSRRGGELLSRPNRNAAAKILRQFTDSLTRSDSTLKILIMGDFNDDPINESIKSHIGTYSSLNKSKANLFYNPMEKLFLQGTGTLAWQDSWNLFDQILLNNSWLSFTYTSWQYYKVRVYNKDYLKADYGNYKGYPFRTFSGGIYSGGYSDHFASYIIIAKYK